MRARVGGLARRIEGGLGPNYWKLLTASAHSNLADGVFWIAFPLYAVQLTDSPVLVAGVTVVGRLPWLLFVLVAGALADRLDRRRTMVSVAVVRAVISAALGIGIVLGAVDLVVLYVTAFVLGVGETLFDTAAQSLMPSIVARDRLSAANGRLYAVELTMNQFTGPPLGGLLAALAVALAFAGSAVAYGVAAVALSLLVGSFRPVRSEARTGIVAVIGEGLGYLARNPVLRTLGVMVGASNLGNSAIFAVLVLYAVAPGPMGLDAFGFGLLMATVAVGSVIGSLIADRAERRFGRANLLALCIAVAAGSYLVPALTADPPAIAAAFATWGAVVMVWNVITVTLRQRIVPDRLLGRINAGYRLLGWGSQPLGALLGGVVAEAFGLRAVFLLGALLTASMLLGRLVLTEGALASAEEPLPGATVPTQGPSV